MGANAVTTVPVYASGEVLTAANLNITNSGIPVFASSVERDAAFGGTGEKTLAEGQYAFLEDTNATQFYDGANWQAVGVAPGLVFITGAAVSAVTSFSLPNDTFTSTYRNYKLVFSGVCSANNQNITMRYRTSGTDNSTANYYGGTFVTSEAGTGTNSGTSGNTSFLIGVTRPQLGYDLIIYQPQLAVNAAYGGAAAGGLSGVAGGLLTGGGFGLTTVFDALSIILAGGHTFTGRYDVYGLANS